jgi:hypothetical protein
LLYKERRDLRLFPFITLEKESGWDSWSLVWMSCHYSPPNWYAFQIPISNTHMTVV